MTSADDPTSLCIGCGLCCDGTLFVKGSINPDGEQEPLSWYKAEFFTEEGKEYFRQPCPHFGDGCCTIYEKRFAVCRTFRCNLLKKCDEGEIEFDKARDVQAEARRLMANVAQSDPDATKSNHRSRLRQELTEALKETQGAERDIMARRLLNLVALDVYLRRWFYKPKRVPASDDPAVDRS